MSGCHKHYTMKTLSKYLLGVSTTTKPNWLPVLSSLTVSALVASCVLFLNYNPQHSWNVYSLQTDASAHRPPPRTIMLITLPIDLLKLIV
jgi:hypothetical protein